jgi:hypothetical protein
MPYIGISVNVSKSKPATGGFNYSPVAIRVGNAKNIKALFAAFEGDNEADLGLTS